MLRTSEAMMKLGFSFEQNLGVVASTK